MPIEVRDTDISATLQVSKSRKLPLLVSAEEMEELFEELGDVFLLDMSRPVALDEAILSKEVFLQKYAEYVEGIQKGVLIDEGPLRPYFSSALTQSLDSVFAKPLSNGKFLLKAKDPLVQLQRHHFIVSDDFYSGVMGEGSVTWGLLFSYPNLYLDPTTGEIGKVVKNRQFPNTALFQKLARWVRDATSPTPFVYREKQVNQPMRLGKQCFDWINQHPTLQEKGLYVPNRKNS